MGLEDQNSFDHTPAFTANSHQTPSYRNGDNGHKSDFLPGRPKSVTNDRENMDYLDHVTIFSMSQRGVVSERATKVAKSHRDGTEMVSQ